MAHRSYDERGDGQDFDGERRHRRHHKSEHTSSRSHRDGDRSGRRHRPEKEVSHHRRTQQDHHHHSSRSKSSSHKNKEPSGFLGSVLKWTSGQVPPPKNDRRYYDSSNAWVRKPEHSSRSRSHRHEDSRGRREESHRHREHKDARPRSLEREHRHRERREHGEFSRENKGERKHRSRKVGERREHRGDRERREHREKREHRDDREDREHRRKREHRHQEPAHHYEATYEPLMPEGDYVPAETMLSSDETAAQVQARLYRESAEVMGYDIRDQIPPETRNGKNVDESNPYGDVAWGEYHKAPVAGLNLPSGAGKTQDIIRERMNRKNRESALQEEKERYAPIPTVAESQISPGTKWPPSFQPTDTEIRRPSFRPLSPVSINGPQKFEFHDSAPRPPTPTSDYDDESVHSLDDDEPAIPIPRRESVQKRPPPAMLNSSNRRALDRASRSGPPPAMYNRHTSLAPPSGRRPSGLDRHSWRPASSVYSQDPPPIDHEVDIALGVRDDDVQPFDSISSAPGPPPRVPPKDAFSHVSATVKPLALPRGSVYNRAEQMGIGPGSSYAGTEWPVGMPQGVPQRKPVPVAKDGPVMAEKGLKKKKKGGMFGKLKSMF